MMLDCCNSVKEKFPDASVVVDFPVSGPVIMDTLAFAIGTDVRLVMTLPLSEKFVGVDRDGETDDGPAGDTTDSSLPLQATEASRRRSDAQNCFSIGVRHHKLAAHVSRCHDGRLLFGCFFHFVALTALAFAAAALRC